jgi:magnesium-transporting ATPase (P-type)
MIPEQSKNSELDKLMHHALKSNDDLEIYPGLTERIIRKLEKKILLRELLLELSFKIGLVLVSLAVLAGILVWANGSSLLTGLYNQFINNWHLIASLLFIIFITLLIDQVGLKFYQYSRKQLSLKI